MAVAPHRPVPPACNWIGYLRLRSTAGPASPQNADAVMTLTPGGGAGAALQVNQARLVVREAAARGILTGVPGYRNCRGQRVFLDSATAGLHASRQD